MENKANEKIYAALGKLSENEREMFLFKIDIVGNGRERSYKDVAEHFGISAEDAQSVYNGAREKLAEELGVVVDDTKDDFARRMEAVKEALWESQLYYVRGLIASSPYDFTADEMADAEGSCAVTFFENLPKYNHSECNVNTFFVSYYKKAINEEAARLGKTPKGKISAKYEQLIYDMVEISSISADDREGVRLACKRALMEHDNEDVNSETARKICIEVIKEYTNMLGYEYSVEDKEDERECQCCPVCMPSAEGKNEKEYYNYIAEKDITGVFGDIHIFMTSGGETGIDNNYITCYLCNDSNEKEVQLKRRIKYCPECGRKLCE